MYYLVFPPKDCKTFGSIDDFQHSLAAIAVPAGGSICSGEFCSSVIRKTFVKELQMLLPQMCWNH